MTLLRVAFKLIALISLAFIAVLIMFAYSLGNDEQSPNAKQKAYRKKWLEVVVKVIGLDIEIKGDASKALAENGQKALWVSNHISWMDIVVVGSQGVGFLSKVEVRKWPIIGWLGEKAGTIFIDRGAKNASQSAAIAIAEKVKSGDNVLVFPEATITSGENVKRFHARIFAPALDHQLLVQPLVIQYLDDNDQRHPQSIWDDQSFFRNVMCVLAQPKIRVVLTYLEQIDAREFEERKVLANLLETQIREIVISKA